MANHSGAQRFRRNGSPSASSSKPSGPLRATIPVSFMTAGNLLLTDSKAPSSSHTKKVSPVSPLPFSKPRQSPWRLRKGSPTPKVDETQSRSNAVPVMRRTASLDAIYLKGQWPRTTLLSNVAPIKLLVDKATQTPEEWQDDKRYVHRGLEASPSRDRKQKSRMLYAYPPTQSTLLVQQPPPFSGSVSPNRVVASTNTESQDLPAIAASQAIPVPPQQQSQNSIRTRNSVEGFNTEIENLVWEGHNHTTIGKMFEPTPDGHRAPIAELFKTNCRSVNTQTPIQAYSTNSSSSDNSSPSGSVSPLVWGLYDPQGSRPSSVGIVEDGGEYTSLSPEDFQGLSLGTSPRRRFLCREPPDGCEKVETLKVTESIKQDDLLYVPSKPSAQFILQPSSSSAFCWLSRNQSTMKSSSGSHLFHSSSGLIGDLVAADSRASSVPPQWPTQSQPQHLI